VLFDAIERNDPSQASYAEDSFSFLNRNSGPVWARIRDELEVWYRDFPDVDGDLRARFRARAPGQHFAAWWELYLHRVFSRQGFRVTVHPKLEGSSDKPDFLVTDGEDTFYVEALTAFSGISEEGRHGAREAEMLDAIEGVETSDWFLQVNFDEVGSSSPRRAMVRRRLETWLSAFDPDVVEAEANRGLPFPSTTVELDDWVLEVSAFPVSTEHRGAEDHRVIGIGPVMVGTVNDYEKIGAALKRKRARYKTVKKPLVLALLATSTFFESDDVVRTLFGTMTAYFSGPGVLVRQARVRDGLWTEKGGEPGRHISGLLVGTMLSPNSFVDHWPTLWLNPDAERPLDSNLPFPLNRWDGDHVESSDASASVRDVFALAPDWPGPEPAFSRSHR
jgi:hypothetical protein